MALFGLIGGSKDSPRLVELAGMANQAVDEGDLAGQAEERARQHKLKCYHSAGALLKEMRAEVKEKQPGEWLGALKRLCPKVGRSRAYQLIAWADFQLTGNLDADEAEWRRISGNARSPSPETAPILPVAEAAPPSQPSPADTAPATQEKDPEPDGTILKMPRRGDWQPAEGSKVAGETISFTVGNKKVSIAGPGQVPLAEVVEALEGALAQARVSLLDQRAA